MSIEIEENFKQYTLDKIPYKRIIGRNIKNAGKTESPLVLFWGASALEINVKSPQVWVKLSSNYDFYEPWITTFINGAQISRFMVPKGEAQWFCIANNMNIEKENLITIMKDTQPMSSDEHHSLLIYEIGLSSEGTFLELKPRQMTIEFIGDSITTGEGLAGAPEEGDWITQWFSASKTFAVQTALELNATWSVVSQSGWGICWGWDGNINSAIPPHYENICSLLSGKFHESLGAHEKFDFNKGYDFVVVNLGTNDNGAFNQPPWKDDKGKEYPLKKINDTTAGEKEELIIKNTVKDFLKNIRTNNPQAKIIWSWGMCKILIVPKIIAKGIDEYRKETGDNFIYSLEFEDMDSIEKLPEDKGSRWHPGSKTHYLARKKLVEFIQKLM